jgi:polyhydroxyalkanoate synthase
MATREQGGTGRVDEFSAAPSLDELRHWTGVIGQAQQMILEYLSKQDIGLPGVAAGFGAPVPGIEALKIPSWSMTLDPGRIAKQQAELFADSVSLWQRFLGASGPASPSDADKDKRFKAPEWREHPFFDLIRQSYLLTADHLLRGVEAIDGVDERQKQQLRFATRAAVDAMSPSNFALTNPQVLAKTIESKGANLIKGLENMLADLSRGQLTQADPTAFEIGRNIATTPGKVIRETPLYQLIQYSPTTETVMETPLIIFPAWINRFYILDLKPEKSFVRWAVSQGLTVFMVSWKSADESLADITFDDYVVRGQLDAIDAVRDLLEVESVHAIGYCVAGTSLATLLALLAARGEAQKVKSATFFTAQVDFSKAGDLSVLVGEEQLKLVEALSKDTGYLDGRYMAATFNLLRGRDLIWSYVVNNYLLGEDYLPFDLLHWNGDTTNLPAKWHLNYIRDLYRDNKLTQGGVTIDGTAIDLRKVETPCYVQAGREDHIAPPESVWKIMDHFSGPTRFVLAGSGHIAGVVNPPDTGKYQYWVNEAACDTLDTFIAGATEHKGSWWPDWVRWIEAFSSARVPAEGARVPGAGKLPAIEDAPGSYVRRR